MPTITVELIQHTSLLQFQADQRGAFLRATEIKPKLDRFLLARNQSLPMKKGPNGAALDYRMRVEPVEVTVSDFSYTFINARNETKTGTIETPYWASEDDAHRRVRAAEGKVKMTLICRDKNLSEAIRGSIQAFFLTTNFGFRQGKGFGSFTVSAIDGESVKTDDAAEKLKDAILKGEACWEPALYELLPPGDDWKSLMQDAHREDDLLPMVAIQALSRQIKSGVNMKGRGGVDRYYIRSIVMKKYAYSKGYSNEKRLIKCRSRVVRRYNADYDDVTRVPPGKAPAGLYNGSEKNHRFVRAMLGLPGYYAFNMDRIKVFVRDGAEKAEIRRFQSPIFFKPIKVQDTWHVYVLLKKTDDRMFAHPFTFTSEGEPPFIINTPSRDEFDLVEFMDCCMNCLSARSGLDVESGGTIDTKYRVTLRKL